MTGVLIAWFAVTAAVAAGPLLGYVVASERADRVLDEWAEALSEAWPA